MGYMKKNTAVLFEIKKLLDEKCICNEEKCHTDCALCFSEDELCLQGIVETLISENGEYIDDTKKDVQIAVEKLKNRYPAFIPAIEETFECII